MCDKGSTSSFSVDRPSAPLRVSVPLKASEQMVASGVFVLQLLEGEASKEAQVEKVWEAMLLASPLA